MDKEYGFSLPFWFWILIGIVIGMLLFIALDENDDAVKELGQAICEEELGTDYKRYYKKVLECQPEKQDYDSIQIKIDSGG